MNPLKSVGARLSLALAVVVAAALALVDLIVVPSLEHNLTNAKLAQLRKAAPGIRAQIPSLAAPNLDLELLRAQKASNARVSVFTELDSQTLLPMADSTGLASDLGQDPIALRAARTLRRASGTVERGEERFAEAALPMTSDEGPAVLLLSASLRDTSTTGAFVRHRLLIAGIIALMAAIAVGYGAASLFARRLRRLERAAERIAGGDFGEPVSDPGSDEVGQLAAAFERMRQRLAGLERARREFIANASHELRTPIFSLGGFLELLENEDLDPETQREFLMRMREQTDRLTKLATDLLDLSRIDAGRVHVEVEAVDLGALAQTLAEEFHAVARASNHALDVDDRAAPAVAADEERALQIGRILVENALVHTPPGTTVRLSTARREGTALLTVEDDGPGIAPEHLPHVFERFYRAVDGSVASGSGLGLAIARELAELMGGTIELHAMAHRTIFGLVLPVAGRDAAPDDTAAGFHVETLGRERQPTG
jgi:signal transduction histidine kinase